MAWILAAKSGILLLRDDSVALLLAFQRPPAEFRAVPSRELPPELRGRAYLHSSYPDEFTKGRFSLAHAHGTNTVLALPVRGADLAHQLEFLYHEASHG